MTLILDSTFTAPVQRVCSWCTDIMTIGTLPATHGICPACVATLVIPQKEAAPMPMFILRDIDPNLWTRVKTKAAAEGVTVKSVILRLLAAWVASVLVIVLTACSSHSPNQPETVIPVAQTAPASIRLTVSTRPDRQVDVTATVLTQDGHFVKDVALVFAMELGSVTPEHAITNSNGIAQAIATTASSTTLTVSTGTLTASTRVDGVPSTLTLYDLSATAGDTVTLTVSGFVSGTSPLVSTSWAFGDGATATSGTTSTTHRYARAGSFTAIVEATDAQGRTGSTRATVNVTAAPAPPAPTPPAPTPPPSLTATLTVTPDSIPTGGVLTFSVTLANRNPGETVTSYQWDLDGTAGYEGFSTIATRVSAPYTTAGVFTAKVLATMSSGRTATGTVGFVVTN